MNKTQNKGVTLIALIITIIVLLILAAVSFNVLLGDNGLIKKAAETKEIWDNSVDNENKNLNDLLSEIDKYTDSYDIYKSPFQYQLLNSYLIPEIEEKLGRKYEVTDFFYEAVPKNKKLAENETYIYNEKENIIIKVDKTKLKRKKAIWFWGSQNEKIINRDLRLQCLEQLATDSFTDLYVSFDSVLIETGCYSEFIRDAYEKGFTIEYLTGDKGFISPYNHYEKTNEYIDKILNQNRTSEYNEKIAGIHYDIEIYLPDDIRKEKNPDVYMDKWIKSNAEEHLTNERRVYFLEFIEKARAHINNNNKEITLAFDMIPSLTTIKAIYKGKEVNMMEELASQSDYISLMAYKDNIISLYNDIASPSILEYSKASSDSTYPDIQISSNTKNFSDGTVKDTKSIYSIAKEYKKVIMIGLETGEDEEDKVTFHQEGKAEMESVIAEMTRMLLEPEYDIVLDDPRYTLKERTAYRLESRVQIMDAKITEIVDNFGFIIHHVDTYLTLSQ